ncbi:hypothetical protein CPB86DRAFT_774956 [Serendipita vermifera]|nr:hypothetical protein CPB86DRAFT_774956 [Serendipita vermifera]
MSLINEQTKIKVSSTLDKSTSRKGLVDRDPGTCWTSAQGLPQWIQLSFVNPIRPERLTLTFQGGFVATKVSIQCANNIPGERDTNWEQLCHIYPEDVNRKQTFDITTQKSLQPEETPEGGVPEEASSPQFTLLKLVFEQSSDFFGRVTLYDLDVQGTF